MEDTEDTDIPGTFPTDLAPPVTVDFAQPPPRTIAPSGTIAPPRTKAPPDTIGPPGTLAAPANSLLNQFLPFVDNTSIPPPNIMMVPRAMIPPFPPPYFPSSHAPIATPPPGFSFPPPVFMSPHAADFFPIGYPLLPSIHSIPPPLVTQKNRVSSSRESDQFSRLQEEFILACKLGYRERTTSTFWESGSHSSPSSLSRRPHVWSSFEHTSHGSSDRGRETHSHSDRRRETRGHSDRSRENRSRSGQRRKTGGCSDRRRKTEYQFTSSEKTYRDKSKILIEKWSEFQRRETRRSHSDWRRETRSHNDRRRETHSHSDRRRETCSHRDRRRKTKYKSTSSEKTNRDKRQILIKKRRLNNCSSQNEMNNQLGKISMMEPENTIKKEQHFWTRTAPANLYYEKDENNPNVLKGTEKLLALCDRFENELVKRGERVRAGKPLYPSQPRKTRLLRYKYCSNHSDSDSSIDSEEVTDEEEGTVEELERKKSHPDRLHPELWHNDPGEMNGGPLCRCSAKAKGSGIPHNIYAGELPFEKCNILTNNADRLHHYRITVSPPTNFLIKTPTIIEHEQHDYIFEGFSMFSHKPLENLPVCKVIWFNIEYTVVNVEEKLPEHFTIRELDLFYDFLFKEILELVDLDFKVAGDSTGCSQFHFMPRFVRQLPENGKELLSMNEVISHLLKSSKPLVLKENLEEIINLPFNKWQSLVDEVKGMVVTLPGKKPCSLRVDQLDKDQYKAKKGETKVPEIIHFGIRPIQLSYVGNPEYQKAWREYIKFRYLLANMPKVSFEDKRTLESKKTKLQEIRTQSQKKRDVTIAISGEGFHRTGIMCDIVQHAMLIPVLVAHLRFHKSLDALEREIGYRFNDRYLLQLAFTHPNYRDNFGTNPDHARNSLSNCGICRPKYGDGMIHSKNRRKKGVNTLMNIMSQFGKKKETKSNIAHNERLEFLGDAVVEFITSIHLFHIFPKLGEGGLSTYRSAIVQNQHLTLLAETLKLDGYMLYNHQSSICHNMELRHAMANCFEALMGALFLDGGIKAADKVFGETLFKDSPELLDVWINYPPHPLQEQEPNGDRHWIPSFKTLKDLTKFEDSIGVKFNHIRLLARAFTDQSIGFTTLTLGSNQRLEFLGDAVLQLITAEYLYKHFPEHHEGHLSLLRSSLVSNRTQAAICNDLGIAAYAIRADPKDELSVKYRADLVEALLGALYVDKGLDYCGTFCNVCYFPRLHDFIAHQDWNDPKSKLQHFCLTLRTMEGGRPEIPTYKVIGSKGPSKEKRFTVAVYFKGKRLTQASGHNIHEAEMNSAKKVLENSQELFPQLDHKKRIISRSMKQEPESRSEEISINQDVMITTTEKRRNKTEFSLTKAVDALVERNSELPESYKLGCRKNRDSDSESPNSS